MNGRKLQRAAKALPHLVDESHEDGADHAGQAAGCGEQAHPEALGVKRSQLLLSHTLSKKYFVRQNVNS